MGGIRKSVSDCRRAEGKLVLMRHDICCKAFWEKRKGASWRISQSEASERKRGGRRRREWVEEEEEEEEETKGKEGKASESKVNSFKASSHLCERAKRQRGGE